MAGSGGELLWAICGVWPAPRYGRWWSLRQPRSTSPTRTMSANSFVQPFARGVRTVIADMTGTRFCDSSGISVLVLAYQKALSNSAELRLVVLSTAVLRALTLVRIDHLLPVHPSLAEALLPEPRHRQPLPGDPIRRPPRNRPGGNCINGTRRGSRRPKGGAAGPPRGPPSRHAQGMTTISKEEHSWRMSLTASG
jgi:anti-anti-sigma factor